LLIGLGSVLVVAITRRAFHDRAAGRHVEVGT